MSNGPILSPERVARWWGIKPLLTSPAGTGLGACALWRFSGPETIEVRGEADPATHIISIGAAGRSRQEYFGDGRLRFNRPCAPGLLNIVPAGEQPRAILNGDGSWSYFHVYLPHTLLTNALAEAEVSVYAGALELIDPQGDADEEIWLTARTLLRELDHGDPLARLRIDTLHQDMAIQLLRRHSSLRRNAAFSRKPARGGLAAWQLRRATDAMEAHLAGDIGLDMLAGVAGCSSAHFSRAFKQSTGMPPFQWLLLRRIERAKNMLAEANVPLVDVALAVGFSAQPQFTTAFKRATGMTPGAWRRERLS